MLDQPVYSRATARLRQSSLKGLGCLLFSATPKRFWPMFNTPLQYNFFEWNLRYIIHSARMSWSGSQDA